MPYSPLSKRHMLLNNQIMAFLKTAIASKDGFATFELDELAIALRNLSKTYNIADNSDRGGSKVTFLHKLNDISQTAN